MCLPPTVRSDVDLMPGMCVCVCVCVVCVLCVCVCVCVACVLRRLSCDKRVYTHTHTHTHTHTCMYVCMYACMYACMYVCFKTKHLKKNMYVLWGAATQACAMYTI